MNNNADVADPSLLDRLARSVLATDARMNAIVIAAEPFLSGRWAYELAATVVMCVDGGEPFEQALVEAMANRLDNAKTYTGWQRVDLATACRTYHAILAAWEAR